MVNLFHSRLVIAVDWYQERDGRLLIRRLPSTPRNTARSNDSLNVADGEVSGRQTTNIVTTSNYLRFVKYDDDETFVKYISDYKLRLKREAERLKSTNWQQDTRIGLSLNYILRYPFMLFVPISVCSSSY